jgi:hypothetical protein
MELPGGRFCHSRSDICDHLAFLWVGWKPSTGRSKGRVQCRFSIGSPGRVIYCLSHTPNLDSSSGSREMAHAVKKRVPESCQEAASPQNTPFVSARTPRTRNVQTTNDLQLDTTIEEAHLPARICDAKGSQQPLPVSKRPPDDAPRRLRLGLRHRNCIAKRSVDVLSQHY